MITHPLTFLLLNSVHIEGEKRAKYRGKAAIAETIRRVEDLSSRYEAIEKRIGTDELKALRITMKRKLLASFGKTVKASEEAEELASGLHDVHHRSAKERVEGHDVAPLMDGCIVIGSIHNKCDNLKLLQKEMSHRSIVHETSEKERPLTNEERGDIHKRINALKINQLKRVC